MASKDTTTLDRRLAVYGPYRRRSPVWMRLLLVLIVLLILAAALVGAAYVLAVSGHG